MSHISGSVLEPLGIQWLSLLMSLIRHTYYSYFISQEAESQKLNILSKVTTIILWNQDSNLGFQFRDYTITHNDILPINHVGRVKSLPFLNTDPNPMFTNCKVVPFDHLHPFPLPSTPTTGNHQSVLCEFVYFFLDSICKSYNTKCVFLCDLLHSA